MEFLRKLGLKRLFTAVDVNMARIKVVELEVLGGKPFVKAMGAAPTPAGALDNFRSDSLLADAIASAVREAGAQNRKVISAIPGSAVVTRIINMPKMPLKELPQAVKWEASSLFPVSLDQMVLRHVILEEFEAGGVKQYRILLAAVQEDLVRRFYSVFAAAGLVLAAVELQGLALWRVFAGLAGDNLDKNKIIAVADIDVGMTQLVVIRNNIFAFCRTLPVGIKARQADRDDEINPLIATAMEEAAVTITDHEDYVVEQVADELRRSLDFYASVNQGTRPERLVLSGEGVGVLAGAAGFLEAELGMEVVPGIPAVSFSNLPGASDKFDPAYNVALGLALREVVR